MKNYEIEGEQINGLWQVSLLEDGEIIASETVHFEEERDELIQTYLESIEYMEKYA